MRASTKSLRGLLVVRLLGVAALPYYPDAALIPEWLEPSQIRARVESGKMHTIPDFSFRDQTGKLRSEKSVQGKVYVASFFFATCPGVCPRLTRALSKVYQNFARDDRVLFLSHTVTPEEDTQAKLAEFGKRYGIDPRRWYLLRGDRKRTYSLARHAYFVDDRPQAIIDNPPSDKELLHSDKVVLIDRQRRIRGIYRGTLAPDLDRLSEDIKTLLAERD